MLATEVVVKAGGSKIEGAPHRAANSCPNKMPLMLSLAVSHQAEFKNSTARKKPLKGPADCPKIHRHPCRPGRRGPPKENGAPPRRDPGGRTSGWRNKGAEQHHKHRVGVLENHRVGGGSQLVGGDIAEKHRTQGDATLTMDRRLILKKDGPASCTPSGTAAPIRLRAPAMKKGFQSMSLINSPPMLHKKAQASM